MKKRVFHAIYRSCMALLLIAFLSLSVQAERKADTDTVDWEGLKGHELTEKYNELLPPYDTTFIYPSEYFDEETAESKAGYKIGRNRAVAIPKEYDSRKQGVISPVKNQGSLGCCWTFGILESAQAGYLSSHKESGADSIDLSEWQLAYFMYNQPVDGLSLTLGDDNYVEEKVGSRAYYNHGGNSWVSVFGMAKGIGFASEDKYPYDTLLEQLSKNNSAQLNDAACYRNNDYILTGANIVSIGKQPEKLKELIMEKGACVVSYASADEAYMHDDPEDEAPCTYYNPGDDFETGGHAVAIVGWDDSFSKENFKYEPKGDGAWLIKNSWGEDWGDAGYFWISYEEESLNNAIFYDIEKAEEYDHIYQYDGTLSLHEMYNGSVYQANVYEAQMTEELKAVSFYTVEDDTDYEVTVYRNPESNNPVSGKLVASELTGTMEKPGYHTVSLKTPVLLEEGDSFSVVVKQTKDGKATFFYCDRDYSLSWLEADSTSKEGQSFTSKNGRDWTDISADGNSNLRIKALTKSSDILEEGATLEFAENEYTVPIDANGAQLTVLSDGSPVNGTGKLSFVVEDNSIARVDDLGRVIPKKIGESMVTVKYGGMEATATLFVTAGDLESIRIFKDEDYATEDNPLEVFLGNMVHLDYTVEPAAYRANVTCRIEYLDKEGNIDVPDKDDYSLKENGFFALYREGLYRITVTPETSEGLSVGEGQIFYVQGKIDFIDCGNDAEQLQCIDYENNMTRIFLYQDERLIGNAGYNVFHFDENTEFEEDYDYLYIIGLERNDSAAMQEIYDVVTKEEKLAAGSAIHVIGSYTGTELAGQEVKVPYACSALVLVSDEEVNAYGFRVDAVDMVIPIQSVSLSPILESELKSGELVLHPGDTKQLDIVIKPENHTETVAYEVGNTEVLTVDEDGTIHALKEGTAQIRIYVSDSGYDNENTGTSAYEEGKEILLNVRVETPEQKEDTDTPDTQPVAPGTSDTPDASDTPSVIPGIPPVNPPGTLPDSDFTGNMPGSDTEKQPVSAGTMVTDSAGKAQYKVLSGNTVAYEEPLVLPGAVITIPSSVKISGKTYKVTEIAPRAFKNYRKLTFVTIGKNVTSIGKEAFKNCASLKSVTIQSGSLTRIGNGAFSGDKKLAKITLKSTKLTKKSIGRNALKGTNKKLVIKVPKNRVVKYKAYFKGKGNKSVKVTK